MVQFLVNTKRQFFKEGKTVNCTGKISIPTIGSYQRKGDPTKMKGETVMRP